ncbi:hypothetical protein N0V95_006979 [Ascochyta clinopodiicola]|nr:hypothetical protein N0V95_006979 [Ascochyta clinopodiicola]
MAQSLNGAVTKMAKSMNETQVTANQLAHARSENDTVECTDDTTNKGHVVEHSTNSTTWSLVQDIGRFIVNEGLTSTLDQFPESIAYTFATSNNKGCFQDNKVLFLGETENFQAWARLKLYPLKPDEVEYLRFSFLSNTCKVERNISNLSINMYPFSLVASQGSKLAREELTVLVRYVFREAAGINLPFSLEDRHTFRGALVTIQKAIETAGGVYKLTNIGPPTRLPKSLSYAEQSLVGKVAEGTNTIKGEVTSSDGLSVNENQMMELDADESLAHMASERSGTRKVFKVPGQPMIKTPAINDVPSKPKAKPKLETKPKSTAALRKMVPAKRRASEASDGDIEQYHRLRDLEEERASIEIEKAKISERQADRKRKEAADTDRLLELRARC